MTTWAEAQQARLAALLDAQASDPSATWIGYYCSDQHGRPANGGASTLTRVPGLVETEAGPLVACEPGSLHATREPHRWRGCRVWVVALLGRRVDLAGKSAALTRETVGEVMPEDVIDPSIAVRLGMRGANLTRAYLYGANLSGADLRGADLTRAYLYGANLSGADLRGADLSHASLSGANLSRASLSGADLSGASLSGADLYGADLRGADLSGAYLGTTTRPVWLDDVWEIRSGVIVRREG